MQTVYACGGGGSQQREVTDGADVVFRDTDKLYLEKSKCQRRWLFVRVVRLFFPFIHTG